MDTSDPAIVFDDKGFCNHCTAYLDRISQMVYQGPASDQTLRALVERVKKAGRSCSYDCVVGVSGGTDSSYLAYLAKQWGLRPLAVHMDNGWNSQEAVRNIKGICDKLAIDYTSYVLNWEDFKDIQLAFLKASIVEMEIPTDVALQAALHKVAAENGIKFILSGGNLANEGILPTSWFYYPKDSKLLKSIHQEFGSRKVKQYETFDFLEEMYYKFVRGIRILYPLNHVRYSKVDAARFLMDNLGWIDYGGAHHESLFTKIVQSYIQPRKFGVDYRRCLYSTQICTGHLTRDQALVQLDSPPYQLEAIEQEKAYVAKKLGMDLPSLEAILELPPKSYRDFPNNEKLLSFIYRTYRRIFRTTHSFPSASYE
jgi:N-acetyl sugar amidotransferase